MPRYQTTLNVTGHDSEGAEMDLQVVVDYGVTWGCEAQTFGPPEKCFPAEPDTVDDVNVLTVDGEKPNAVQKAYLEDLIAGRYDDKLLEAAAQQADAGPDPDDARDRAFDDKLWD